MYHTGAYAYDGLRAVFVSGLEAVAALLGVLNIALLVRRSVWNYAFGIAMVALYAPVFFRERLYSDAVLQLFFLVVQIYGWWSWARVREQAGTVVVRRLSLPGIVAWAGACLVGWAAWSTAMHRLTDAAFPYWDGAVAAMSVTAQAMLARRLIENWPLWVAVDVVAVALYWTKGLIVTAGLYVLFLALSLWGWRAWAQAPHERAAAA